MDDIDDKDFSWTPAYAWRTCIKMLFFRAMVVVAIISFMLLCFAVLEKHFLLMNGGYTRLHGIIAGCFAAAGVFVFMRNLMNATGLSEWAVFFSVILVIFLIWISFMGLLFLYGAGEAYILGTSVCCGFMATAACFMLKFQDFE